MEKGNMDFKFFKLMGELKKSHMNMVLQELTHVEFTTLHVWKRGHQMKPDGEITVSDLAKYTGTNLPSVSRILKQLEEKGFIEREIGGEDRRAISVIVTKNGEEVLFREENRLKQYRDAVYQEMGESEILELFRLMEDFLRSSNTVVKKLESVETSKKEE